MKKWFHGFLSPDAETVIRGGISSRCGSLPHCRFESYSGEHRRFSVTRRTQTDPQLDADISFR